MSKHCPNSAIYHKRARSSLETISGKYADIWRMKKINRNRNQSAARKRHLYASINYGAHSPKMYVTLLTRKTKLSRFLALEPSQGVQPIPNWCPLSQARNLSTLSMLNLAPRLPNQIHVDPNGKELPRRPSYLHKKLLNFSYWQFSCWL